MIGKAILMVVGIIVSAIVAATTDGVFTGPEIVNVVLVGFGAGGVWLVPNLSYGVAKYAKAIIAMMFAAGTLAVDLIGDGLTWSEGWQLVVAAVAAVGVIIPKAPQWHNYASAPPVAA